ncbi:Sulfite efflux pump SSU1 [Cyphellophora attinorum]|uniref:Sulfite efflux pump SSU1 n=1 Tax=Cyphellophora attinorum TaxID=1664694 RepID=A0A0N0NJE1_9EURO|nr:Sulfite efflux pump SSU1 [Phialophora attinorum]KPI36519.1 Sulfite efflux pump SSU1 [Phialophora attinorum]
MEPQREDIESQATNGATAEKDVKPEPQSLPSSTFMRVCHNFSTVWFTVAMDTGVLSVVLRQFPYPSHWTRVCSAIMFVTTVVLAATFASIYLIRWTRFRKDTFNATHLEAEEIALQACPAITWALITIQVQLTCAQSWGYGCTILAYVMWWIGLVWIVSICVTLYLHLIKHPSQSIIDRFLPTAVFIPIVGIFTQANAAGVIVNGAINDTRMSAAMAVPIIIVGFMLVGFGLGLAIVMYSIYAHRLMTSGFPEALKIPSMILTIGPCGQSASALLNLSAAAVAHGNFEKYAKGFFLTSTGADIIRIQCTLAALLLVGFAIFWMCVDYYALVTGLIRRKIHPSLFWWSSIFPVGTVVTALSGLGKDLDSPAFKICSIILFVFLLCIYFVNWGFTVPMTWSGKFLGLEPRVDRLDDASKSGHHWHSLHKGALRMRDD